MGARSPLGFRLSTDRCRRLPASSPSRPSGEVCGGIEIWLLCPAALLQGPELTILPPKAALRHPFLKVIGTSVSPFPPAPDTQPILLTVAKISSPFDLCPPRTAERGRDEGRGGGHRLVLSTEVWLQETSGFSFEKGLPWALTLSHLLPD